MGKDTYDDMAGALSAVLATRSNKVKDAIPDFIYLTGNKWNDKVEKFKVDAFGMADYNSSDLILQYGEHQFRYLHHIVFSYISGCQPRWLRLLLQRLRVFAYCNTRRLQQRREQEEI